MTKDLLRITFLSEQVDAPNYEIIVSDDSKSDSSRILIEKIFLMFIGEKEKRLVLQEIETPGLPEQVVNGLYFWMMIVLLKKNIWLPMQPQSMKTQIFLYLREESLLTDREKHGSRDARKMSMAACFGQVICASIKTFTMKWAGSMKGSKLHMKMLTLRLD